jgi:hypothetical protein
MNSNVLNLVCHGLWEQLKDLYDEYNSWDCLAYCKSEEAKPKRMNSYYRMKPEKHKPEVEIKIINHKIEKMTKIVNELRYRKLFNVHYNILDEGKITVTQRKPNFIYDIKFTNYDYEYGTLLEDVIEQHLIKRCKNYDTIKELKEDMLLIISKNKQVIKKPIPIIEEYIHTN